VILAAICQARYGSGGLKFAATARLPG